MNRSFSVGLSPVTRADQNHTAFTRLKPGASDLVSPTATVRFALD
jgi:hypothetical protein